MAGETREAAAAGGQAAAGEPAAGWRSRVTRPEVLFSAGFLVLALAVWETLSRLEVVHEIILPAPSQILEGTWTVVTLENFHRELGTTLLEVLVGFLLALVLGVGIGIFTGTYELFRKSIYPYIVAFQVIPKVVFAPIFLAWFGFGIESKIVMAAVIAFFPCLINTAVGLRATSEDEVLLMRSYVATRGQIFLKLTLPKALPFIFAGMKTAFTFALQMDLVFAVIFIISATGIILYAVLDYLDRKIVFWRRGEDGL